MNKKKIAITTIIVVFVLVIALIIFNLGNKHPFSNFGGYYTNSCGSFTVRKLAYSDIYYYSITAYYYKHIAYAYTDRGATIFHPIFNKIKWAKNYSSLKKIVKFAFPNINYNKSEFLTLKNHTNECMAIVNINNQSYTYSYKYRIFSNGKQKEVQVYDFNKN